MKITELVLDGFKSYPVRTSISGWDPSFNAITGLNGSGKSNILDSICFVLGITNLSTVRAQNLLDLIYKRGATYVVRASVTIVFDNSDKTQAPVGFEQQAEISVTRQIALNGTSKYLICGHRSTQQNVQSLFQSVQLNINNPNFLIAQGKITKVLNMRPQEILSMLEEAAGTSMFEDKKDKAVKTMTKKEKRLDEIQELLRDEIVPKLDKLREEKRIFLEFQKKTSELEKLNKLVVAWDWQQAETKKRKGLDLVKEGETKLNSHAEAKKRISSEILEMEKEISEIGKRRDRELAKGGKIQGLEVRQHALAKDLSKFEAQVEISAKNFHEEKTNLNQLETNLNEILKTREEKEKETKTVTADFTVLKSDYDALTESLKSSEDLLQSLVTGLSSSAEESSSSGFMGQLAKAKELATNFGTEAERAKARIQHLQKELSDAEPQAKKALGEGKDLIKEFETAKSDLKNLQTNFAVLDWTQERETEIRDRLQQHSAAVRQLLESRDAIKSNLAALDFEYDHAKMKFDASAVKGVAANLISINAANLSAATALEVCAGGRLYNVVIENEHVGSDLLSKGNLRKRVTFIPLNKIKANVAAASTLKTVARISPDTKLALEFIGYDQQVENAMQFIFGNTLICRDSNQAKLVTFHNEVRMRSVTLEGDVYSPDGTLSGGSRSQGQGILVKVQELHRIETELSAAQHNLRSVEAEWQKAKTVVTKFNQAKKEIDLKSHEVNLLQERISESSATRIFAKVDNLKTSIAELTTSVTESKSKQKTAQIECKRIENEMIEFSANRGSKLEQIKSEIKSKKAQLSKKTATVKILQRQVQTFQLELEQLNSDVLAAETELADGRINLTKTETSLQNLIESKEICAKSLKLIENEILDETKLLSAYKEELDALDSAVKAKRQDFADCELNLAQIELEIERAKKEQKTAIEAVNKLETRFEWIRDESQTFGQPNSLYSFTGLNMNDVKAKCAQLYDEQQKAKKRVNPKVLSMIENVEKKEKELIAMCKQVLKDKLKIEETVKKLDDYKKQALLKTWEKVDAEFGNIFAELLPGNFSKLQPPAGMDITKGLEVKVRLGSVWKASLTELSGGQRSLIALSLILALLHFKPAPMYILDEIDAALDLSHTENIGRLFRTRFKGSQFIVVSLKDGLFSNANVLFRARFRDGTSIVERTAQRSTSNLYANSHDKENQGAARKPANGKTVKRIAAGATDPISA